MDYQKIYNQLVEKAKPRGLDKGSVDFYTEVHHIIPRCLGGSNDKENLVMFSGREHYIAHMLLWKAYPDNVSLMRAAHIMSSRWDNKTVGGSGGKVNSRVYAKLREEYSEAVKEQCSGEGNPFFGKTHSEETRAKFRKWHSENKEHKINSLAKKAGVSVEEYKKLSAEKRRLKERYYMHESLEFWRENNQKYMKQFSYKVDGPIIPDKETISFPHHSLSKEENRVRWSLFYLYKDFWKLCGEPKDRILTEEININFGTNISRGAIKSIVARFTEGWEPESDPDWLSFMLNNNPKDYYDSFQAKLSESSVQRKEKFFSNWVANRNLNRNKIEHVIKSLKIVQHKNSSGDNCTLSLVDVAEANILWASNMVMKSQIAKLLGVKPNTISTATSPNLRWKEITGNLDSILLKFYGDMDGKET